MQNIVQQACSPTATEATAGGRQQPCMCGFESLEHMWHGGFQGPFGQRRKNAPATHTCIAHVCHAHL
eukprot:995412-Pelagomonas_calceolata.AAC.2